MIVIPPDRLDSDLLVALIEEFVLKEGTDYGEQEFVLESKVNQVRGQIDRGEVLITFDEETESCNLMTLNEYRNCTRADELLNKADS